MELVAAMIRVVDTKDQAVKRFEVFHDRAPTRATQMPFTWPKKVQEIGVGHAEMYRSNKWKSKEDQSEYEDYKHIVESTRLVYVTPGWIRERTEPWKKLPVYGPTFDLKGSMPRHFTRLGRLIGVQIRLYEDDDLKLSKGDGARIYEVDTKHGMLGAAEHPETSEVFLFIYTTDGVHMLLTGEKLDVERDGIVG